ncbi:hypothetical protein [Tomitella gaofuii]|uniref:hypothetical protein n=1 Tax=Tomitella gaofuii TaxID=2760083 RepID=UPI0015FA964C|nr:hypothetical protein [Tomitella gaofuii]
MIDTFTTTPIKRPMNQAAAELSWADKSYTIETSANVTLRNSATAWLTPSLVLAMKKGLDLSVNGPVDAKALDGATQAQSLFCSWWPDTMHAVKIDATSTTATAPDNRGVGCFFSGGLDSFYSAVKNQPNITHLIFVQGFDIFLKSEDHYETALRGVQAAADELGKELITVTTNIRPLFEYNGGWDIGYALPNIVHLLSDHLRAVYIPAGEYGDNLPPRGTHPDLDHLWTSSVTEIIHDGLEANRIAKARAIKESPAAMAHLRVCFANRSDTQNCGECEKCVRTAINLRIVGASGACTSFPEYNVAKTLRKVPAKAPQFRYYLEHYLQEMNDAGVVDPELRSALEQTLRRTPRQEIAAELWNFTREAKLPFILLSQKIRRSIGSRVGRPR